ncbi:MAG TPA: phenylpyruvate tautomerase MIF-related protein [Kiritimatiellia bacterium]|nr:phenylpyruvate tautomerase MIF-related protein [Kiritimatiellia bacterium]HPA78906.1 phenylpyruvate tautomerase MIF-related protein [Kiritimatiellia bacterium]
MPSIRVQISEAPFDAKKLLPELSRLTAESLGKPEQYVMAVAEPAAILMSREPGPAAMAEVRSIGGLNAAKNTRLTQALCALLKSELGIPPERVYVTFVDVKGENWGHDNSIFG